MKLRFPANNAANGPSRTRRRGVNVAIAVATALFGAAAGVNAEPVPTGPIAIGSSLRACLAMDPKTQRDVRRACLSAVAETLDLGLDYQRCLMNIVRPPGAPPCPVRPQIAVGQAVDCTHSATAHEPRCLSVSPGEQLRIVLRALEPEDPKQTAAVAARFLRTAGPGSYTLVAQGGVSLGSWQAGYAYVITELLKTQRESRSTPVYRTVAGTSAGAVNSLAFGLEGCRPDRRRPQDTLAWKLWIERVRLFSGGDVPGLMEPRPESSREAAVFSDGPLNAAMDDARLEMQTTANSLRASCSFDLGFVATHLTSSSTPIHLRVDPSGDTFRSVVAPRASERFGVRITVRAAKPAGAPAGVDFRNVFEPPAVAAPGAPAIPNEAYFAQIGEQLEPTRDEVLSGIRASGAVPFAFAPVDLNYRGYDATAQRFVSRRGLFVDGGVLENTPLGLAVALNERSSPFASNPWFSELSTAGDTYIYVSPGVHDWEPESLGLRADPAEQSTSPLGTYLNWMLSVANAGSMARLSQATEEHPFLRQDRAGDRTPPRMVVPLRHFPITGDQLGQFFAFASRSFRIFDYVVGMVDAEYNYERISGHAASSFSLPEGPSAPPDADRLTERHACTRAFYQQCVFGQPLVAADCGEQPKLPVNCKTDDTEFNALLKANWRFRRWVSAGRPQRYPSDLDAFLGMLERGSMPFADVPEPYRTLLKERSGQSFQRVLAGDALERLRAKERFVTRLTLGVGGRALVDAAVYREFPKWHWGLGYPERGLEAELGLTLKTWGQSSALRWDNRLRAYGFRSNYVVFPGNDLHQEKMLNLDASTALTWAITPGTPGLFDFEFDLGPLAAERHKTDWDGGRWVFYRFGAEAGISAVLLQRVYLRFENQLFFNRFRKVNGPYIPSTQQDADPYRLQVSVGLRFF